MSNEFTCDDCRNARETTENEVEFGTHYCRFYKEFVECYINCGYWLERLVKDSEEERQLKLKEKVNKWFYNLDDNYKLEILESYYPDKAHLMGTSEMWHGLDWNDKWEIYRSEKDEV